MSCPLYDCGRNYEFARLLMTKSATKRENRKVASWFLLE